MRATNYEGGEELRRQLDRLGWSASYAATQAEGVSGASVRAWLAGRTLPTVKSAKAITATLDRDAAAVVLRAWGFSALADATEQEPPARLDYSIDRDGIGRQEVPLNHKTEVEVVSRIETSTGVEWLARTASGTLLIIRPVYSIQSAEGVDILPTNDK